MPNTDTKSINLSALSLPELRKLKEDVTNAIQERESEAKKELLSAFEAKAKEAGFELSEILPTGKPSSSAETTHKARRKGTGSVAPKYRHPTSSPDQTWSGRGRQPTWVKDYLSGGGTLEDITIKK